MSIGTHKQASSNNIHCGIITVSDTRTTETDRSGHLMVDLLKFHGHSIKMYQIVRDDQQLIKEAIEKITDVEGIQAILINGGTGIAARDVTIESVSSLFDKEVTGFGELFRYLSFTEDIGSAAMLSRATAGIYKNKIIFVTPGSTGAVRLAMEKLILPELGHIIYEIEKDIK
ncbi:MogA/MoaB family molybdenum cofactor biosynthesis protein [Heyndrickxia vini]|uniref:Molybdenum cofactor biosynthesis protein B n=1 Tax=Heyndrickxia vini TaxID=1476025 RepID=A0ABX7E4F6_9BACI|nr:MogA/MoaB family molybdenum cofactor biosynthesis protein [Heyndrickxia vini]QQZ10613.1 MogA/MoaB family molybdenum cofactor biosynthesis protein [Heyndrickxia vini]